jgi:sulfate permease, SulP family
MTAPVTTSCNDRTPWLTRLVPALHWLPHYEPKHLPNTEHFRNVQRHQVQTLPYVLLLRIDESLYFANAKYIEDFVLCAAAERPQLRHLVLICNAINFIDASALETLTDLRTRMQDAGIELHLTEVKGPVMDRLADTEFIETLGSERVFLTTEEAYEKLASPKHSMMKPDEIPK